MVSKLTFHYNRVWEQKNERNVEMNHYKHITIEERENLLRLLSEGKKIREIAREIGRAASTISRELKRNKKQKEKYSPSKAQFRY